MANSDQTEKERRGTPIEFLCSGISTLCVQTPLQYAERFCHNVTYNALSRP